MLSFVGPSTMPRVCTLTSYPSWPQDPCLQRTLVTRIQVLGHCRFSDGFSQMPALGLAYCLDSYFLIPPSLLELLVLSCQLSCALEKLCICLLFFCFIQNFVCSVLRELLQTSCQKQISRLDAQKDRDKSTDTHSYSSKLRQLDAETLSVVPREGTWRGCSHCLGCTLSL